MLSGLRLSASTFFFISRAVCFLPRFWSAWGDMPRGRTQERTLRGSAQVQRPGCGSQAARLCACAHLGQVAAVVGAHGGQSLLLLQVVLGSPLGVLLLPAGLLLLQRPRPTTQGWARCPSPQAPRLPRPTLSRSSRSWAGSALSQGCCRALVTGQGWGPSGAEGAGALACPWACGWGARRAQASPPACSGAPSPSRRGSSAVRPSPHGASPAAGGVGQSSPADPGPSESDRRPPPPGLPTHDSLLERDQFFFLLLAGLKVAVDEGLQLHEIFVLPLLLDVLWAKQPSAPPSSHLHPARPPCAPAEQP